MKAAERQRTECATTVAQCKRPSGRAALGEAAPVTSRPEGATKNLLLPHGEYSVWESFVSQEG